MDKNYDNQFNNFGGALRNNSKSNLILINCLFENNSSEKEGGAIYNRGKLKIQDSTIQNNFAVMGGGGIYNLTGELDIIKTTLKANSVNNANINYGGESDYYCYGGAINNEKGAKLKIHTSKVMDNEVKGFRCYGGAVFNNGEIEIEDTLFCENISKRNGGALYNNSGILKINKSKISNNIATDGDGGGLYNYKGEIHLSNSEINNNQTNYDGGGICNKFKIHITNCKLHNNTVKNRNGGAICNFGDLRILESSLNENTAKRNGGAIWYNDEDKVMINNCTFKDNKPNDVYNEKN